MNPLKAEVKILTAESIGRKMEEMQEESLKQQRLQQGAKEALEFAAKRTSELAAHVDKDLQEGKLDDIIGEPLKVADYAKQYIRRCVGALDNLATQAEVARLGAIGRHKAFGDAAKYVSGVWKEEKEKLESFAEALASGEVRIDEDGPSPTGHPGPTLKSQRLEEVEKDSKPAKASKGNGAHSENPLAARSVEAVAAERKRKAAAKKGAETRKKKAAAKKKEAGAKKGKAKAKAKRGKKKG
jgi:hypothetical protein